MVTCLFPTSNNLMWNCLYIQGSAVSIVIVIVETTSNMALAIPPQHLPRLQFLLQEDEDEDELALVLLLYQRRRVGRRRQYWVRPWISRRPLFGAYENLMVELERESHGDFKNYLRMEPAMLHELLQRVTPRLTKRDTNFRKALEPGLKLASSWPQAGLKLPTLPGQREQLSQPGILVQGAPQQHLKVSWRGL